MTASDWVGLVGGSAGIIGAAVSVATLRRDRARLQIRVIPDMRITSPGGDDLIRAMLEELGPDAPGALYYRDPDKTWTFIEIANIGRRPIKIVKVGFVASGKAPYLMRPDFKPVVLNEGEDVDLATDQDKLPRVYAAFAADAAGRKHYGGFRRSASGIYDRTRAWLGIYPFTR